MSDDSPYRLSRAVVPERYELEITPDLPAAIFTGTARITVQVTEVLWSISLNAAELTISSARLIDREGTVITATAALNEATEVATLALSAAAEPGTHILELDFTGELNDKLRGFYRSTFVDADAQQHVIATTQFEATDARRAFPCWDEPAFKAVFSVALIVDKDLTALSNAAVKEETDLANGTRRVQFHDTMIMSTYLVAFIVGPFVVSEPVDVDGVPLRVACIPGREGLTPFALESGAAALRYLTEYFGIDYPGDKLDLIAIPDFAFGAMENLGCVTFRETALLLDPQRASRLEVERVADVVGHEIAHMWFGDLVTMKWWNGIWLNEAFATFMQMSFTNDFRPNWQRWTSFAVAKSAAMNIDSLSSTRPIEFEVFNPAEAQGMFDLLTYQKGAAVLRMLEQHLGPQAFATGISAYLRKHAYGNAETTDLWDALEEEVTDEPVRAMMDSWILQGGHPVVQASLGADRRTISLSQRRFRYQDDDASDVSWLVPVGVRGVTGGEGFDQKLLLGASPESVVLSAEPEWLVANRGANGFYRVSYDDALLVAITQNVDQLDALERFAFVNDLWALCLAGITPLTSVVSVTRAMGSETDPDVWSALLAPLRLLDKVIDDAVRPGFQAFVHDLLTGTYERLGWQPSTDEEERVGTLRGSIIAALGVLADDGEVQRKAAQLYRNYEADPESLSPDLVVPLQACMAATNRVDLYQQLKAKFLNEASTPQEEASALAALARFTEPALVAQTLSSILAGEVRTQDAPYAIAQMLTQRGSGPTVWQWCEEHWAELTKRFPENSISRMVEGVAAQVDPDFAVRVQDFLTSHPVPQGAKAIQQTCERLRVNAAFYIRSGTEVNDIFG